MYAVGLYLPSEVEGTVGMMRLFDGFPNLWPMNASSGTRDRWLLKKG
jgi:hypothetical protein